MTAQPADDDLIAEIAFAEQTLRESLAELDEHLNAGKRGEATEELVQHCREMAEILTALVDQLGMGTAEDDTRAATAHMLARLVQLEREIKLGSH